MPSNMENKRKKEGGSNFVGEDNDGNSTRSRHVKVEGVLTEDLFKISSSSSSSSSELSSKITKTEGKKRRRDERWIEKELESLELKREDGSPRDEDDESEEVISPSISTAFSNCPINNESGDFGYLLSLKPGTVFHMKGALDIRVISGVLRVLGHELTSSDSYTSIYSPKGYSLLSLESPMATISHSSILHLTKSQLQLQLSNLTFTNNGDRESFLGKLDQEYTVLILKKLDQNSWIPYMTQYLNPCGEKTSFFKKDVRLNSPDTSLNQMEKKLDINIFTNNSTNKARLFEWDCNWESAVQSVKYTLNRKEHPKMITAGGKGVGKSTFNRFILNRLLAELKTSVVFIDLDPGQAELTIPGLISATKLEKPLLGPNFCNVRSSNEYLLYLGDVNISNVSQRYLDCVKYLFDSLIKDSDLNKLPWIINTMGFNKGLGKVLMVDILRYSQPSTVVTINSRFHRKNYDLNFDPDYISNLKKFTWLTTELKVKLNYNVLTYEAIPESQSAKDMRSNDIWGIPEARKLRDMVLLSYFGRFLIKSKDLSLNSQIPYKVKWKNLGIQILHAEVGASRTLSVLNSSIVTLSIIDLEQMANSPISSDMFRIVPSSFVVNSIGVGIVRAIDPKEQCFYLLTSVNEQEILERINCISTGAIFLPSGPLLHPNNKYNNNNNKQRPYVQPKSKHPLNQEWIRSHKPRPE